ncbi:MAG: GNAT family N-acetyltransferase [Verrucomicrobia bacterium]|nr:GNAT family N-acetyltransferase [Verrucomicrobiota bacterium]
MPQGKPTPVIKLYQGIEEFAALQPRWKSLTSRVVGGPRFCNSPWFHQCALNALSDYAQRVLFATVGDGDELQAVLPVVIREERWKGIPFRCLELVGRVEFFVRDGAVADESFLAQALPRLLKAVRAHPGFQFDSLAFRSLPEGSGLLGACDCLPAPQVSFASTFTQYIPLPEGPNIASDFRRNLRRRARRLGEIGDVVHQVAPGDLSREEAFRIFLDLEASGWKGAGGSASAVKLSESRCQLYRLLTQGTEETQVFIHLLRCGPQPIAAYYTVTCGPTLTILTTGYDESFSRYGPGFLLCERVLEWAMSQPQLRECDLYTNVNSYAEWQPKTHPLCDTYAFRRTPQGLLSWALMRWRNRSGWHQSIRPNPKRSPSP